MTATPGAAFRATVAAAGFVLDVPVIGAAEAAGRVLAHWQDGAELRELPDGRWLLTLAEPVGTRADRAPGLPLRRAGGGALVAVGSEGAEVAEHGPGQLVLTTAGRTDTHRIAGLTVLDPSGWLDPTGLTPHRPRPVGAAPEPTAEPVLEALPPRPRPDLRAAAGIRPRSERARRLTEGDPAEARPDGGTRPGPGMLAGRVGWAAYVLAVLLMAAVVLVWAAGNAGLIADRGFRPFALLAGIGLGLAVVLRSRGIVGPHRTSGTSRTGSSRTSRTSRTGSSRTSRTSRTSGTGTAGEPTPAAGRKPRRTRRPLLGDLLARLALRTPAGRLVADRHARYLRELTRAFEQRRWEDALRDAIQLAGGGPGTEKRWLSLGLPHRHTGDLRPTPRRGSAGASSPLSGPTVHQHLSDLYRHAAAALERDGRIDEAAYVLADLLNTPAEAVALLDRHGRTAQAAELAEGRELAADLVVRLWWRAGEHERAIRTAHRRAAFAAAVERLTPDHPEAARELRAAWARHCREAGDRLGAVEAAWPEESLRPTVVADLRDAVALGGPTRSRALPYLLALGAGEATRTLARAVLDGDGDPRATGRSALAAGLAALPAADPATDRELATAAARAAVRDGGFGGQHGGRTEAARFDQLIRRADPLVAADLARPRPISRPADARPEYTAADRPGTLPVLDAVMLESGSVLVACGQAGVRLLAADGRTRARWDVPAEQLVLADHGGSALLVAGYGRVREIARLDLATRAVRPWATLEARQLVPSFDGRHLITADRDGIAVLDTLAPRPTVVWRELGGGQRLAGRIARTPGGCAAVVVSDLPDGSPLTELWRWDLPGWELRSRLRLDDAAADTAAEPGGSLALATVGLLAARPLERPDRTVLSWTTDAAAAVRELTFDGAAPYGPTADGDHWALTVPRTDGSGLLVHTGAQLPVATVAFPQADPEQVGIRRHADAVTFRHRSGRVLAVSADGATLLANLRVTTDRGTG
ncbi:bpX6 domain-containing protein [Kitasatospora sp. NPDC127111]|uniref:bpX6 domain-containing protein n=1 Tax=Kitasatospora sp. NPDC127111 TaxID=3345363 RepID=UPI00362B36F6